jgi:superfamily II DNA or RNA helicase
MSTLIKIDDIPVKKRETIIKNLYVRPLEQKVFNPKTKRMESKTSTQGGVEAFDFIQDTENLVCIPFSFWYHNLSSIQPLQSLDTRESKNLKFSKTLPERQTQIREETFDILNRTKSVLLCLHTGFGKTIYTLYLLSKFGLKAIIMCHRSIIIDQWRESIEKYLPNANWDLLDTKRHSNGVDASVDILICNVINVPKLSREVYAQFGVVIVDEVHTVCTEQFSKCLTMVFPDYLIGLSATPFRTDGMDRLIELYMGPEVVYKPMWRVFNAYKLKTGFSPKIEYQADGKINWNSVLESQALDTTRNNLIVRLTQWFCKRKILILVKRKDHANILKRLILQESPSEGVGVFVGSEKSLDMTSRVLIATTSKGGVGLDHPGLDMLITAADVKENFLQYLGRVFRRDDTTPIYVDLIDDNNTINLHANERRKVIESVGGTMYDFSKSFTYFN